VARAWSDEAFKARLLAEPGPVLAEQGIAVLSGVVVQVHENTPTVLHMALPPKPTEDLSDEQLDALSGGSTVGSAGSLSSIGTFMGTVSTFGSAGTAGSAS
jgi:hypothetical protein